MHLWPTTGGQRVCLLSQDVSARTQWRPSCSEEDGGRARKKEEAAGSARPAGVFAASSSRAEAITANAQSLCAWTERQEAKADLAPCTRDPAFAGLALLFGKRPSAAAATAETVVLRKAGRESWRCKLRSTRLPALLVFGDCYRLEACRSGLRTCVGLGLSLVELWPKGTGTPSGLLNWGALTCAFAARRKVRGDCRSVLCRRASTRMANVRARTMSTK